MSKSKYDTREAWLEAAVEQMRPLFSEHGYTIPTIRVACGWPSVGGTAKKKRRIGECWSKEAATDKTCQIFISPYLHEEATDQGVLATHVHEVVHAVVGVEEGHNKVFGKCARAVGLEGKLTATIAGPVLIEKMESWVNSLGPYPHARLDSFKRPTKKQSTRMIKMECPECGYVARTSRKWLDEAGPCICPIHKIAMKFEVPDDSDDDDGGDE
jgi:SprT-like family protein